MYEQPKLGLVEFLEMRRKKGQRVNQERTGGECDQGTFFEIPKYINENIMLVKRKNAWRQPCSPDS